MLENDIERLHNELMDLRAIVSVNQMEIEILRDMNKIRRRQINALMWAYCILAAFFFLGVMIVTGI